MSHVVAFVFPKIAQMVPLSRITYKERESAAQFASISLSLYNPALSMFVQAWQVNQEREGVCLVGALVLVGSVFSLVFGLCKPITDYRYMASEQKRRR
jgi:hypothetical protein